MHQGARNRTLDGLRRGHVKILVATDVAARGIDVPTITHVVNYDLPKFAEDYVHRIGRTARAGAEGKAISLADEDGAFYLEAIEEYCKLKIPTEWAEDDLFVHDYKRSKPRPKHEAKTHGKSHARPHAKPGEAIVTTETKKRRRRPRPKKAVAAPDKT